MAQRFAASPSILTFMAESPNYGKLSSTSAMERAKNEAANLMGNAKILGAGITGENREEIAKYRGKAGLASDRADGYETMMAGVGDGVDSIIGGIGRMPKGGKSLDGYGYGDYTNLHGENGGYEFPFEFSNSSWMTGG